MWRVLILSLNICLASEVVWEADWGQDVVISPGTDRENIYKLEPKQFESSVMKGRLHAVHYPVEVTGILIPYRPFKNFFENTSNNKLKEIILKAAKQTVGFSNLDEMFQWLGLVPYPQEGSFTVQRIPYPTKDRPEFPMGVTLIDTPHGKGLTFSCAACHASNLFGTPILGLTNKETKANRFFVAGKKYSRYIDPLLFKISTGATDGEVRMMMKAKRNLKAVGAKNPSALGLDTSLPQVALSLTRRNEDPYATKSRFFEIFPRYNKLSEFVSESKPAVWWNLKYKTRWLSDGSIVQGNPILTNFLWNELGRGTDLHELEGWMKTNLDKIKELTAAVFATKAPKWTEFFPVNTLDLESSKRGQKIYRNMCMDCHGDYVKRWEVDKEHSDIDARTYETVQVIYHDQTPVEDMGTDPNRYLGMREFAKELNELAISKWMKTIVVPQEGYVPPPLVGIWARWPYLHNNSIPNLCAFLSIESHRPNSFYQGPALDKDRDFDQDCVGFPIGDKTPDSWKKEERLFDTTKSGLSNKGHTKAFTDEDGNSLLSDTDRKDLINFLKTL